MQPRNGFSPPVTAANVNISLINVTTHGRETSNLGRSLAFKCIPGQVCSLYNAVWRVSMKAIPSNQQHSIKHYSLRLTSHHRCCITTVITNGTNHI